MYMYQLKSLTFAFKIYMYTYMYTVLRVGYCTMGPDIYAWLYPIMQLAFTFAGDLTSPTVHTCTCMYVVHRV